MKKKKRIVTIILWLAALAVLFIWSSPEQKVDRFVAKYAEVLEESLGTDLSGGYPGGLGIQYYNCWEKTAGIPSANSASAVASARTSVLRLLLFADDEPRGFQSVEVTLVPDGENCWTWHAEGDNRGMTKKIQDRWYYFEAWL